MKRLVVVFACAALLLPAVLVSQEKVDLAVIHRIRNEAFQNSKVMEHAFYLTDVNGPRLTGSPGYRAAGEWAIKRLKEYGVDGARLERWPWGRSWSLVRFSAHLLEPQYAPLIGVPAPWSPSTNGAVSGEPMLAVLNNATDPAAADYEAFFEKYRGKLKGKIVLIQAPRPLALETKAASHRYEDGELAAEALAPDPAQPGGPRQRARLPFAEGRKYQARLNQFLREEGALAVLLPGRGSVGTVFAQGSATYRDQKNPPPAPTIYLAAEHYNRIARLLEKNIPLKVEVEVQARFLDDTPDAFNVIAEIPGGRKKDEVVMVGAHLDSWTGGTGATDNAAGCAVVMEVMRILKALDLKMDRTVRLGLWGGEEGGLIGGRNYVTAHYADRATMELKPEHAKFQAYFNFDNGSGKIRGIYLQGNDMLRPIFETWMAPFRDLGATTVTIRNTTGTDHLSFDEVGLPGFQFIQDTLEYDSRTHHSNMDVYDRLQAGDLQQAAAIMAAFAYHAAVREQLLPRKPLPKPRPQREGTAGGGQ